MKGNFHVRCGVGEKAVITSKPYLSLLVVSINHRLNLLGFLDLSAYGEKYSANNGILDIVAALEWIHDNISNFGGDKNNLTLFGQSGGGAKILSLTAMPAAKGLFHKAINQSGAVELIGMSLQTQDTSRRVAELTLQNLNLSPAEVSKLEIIPYAELSLAANKAFLQASKEFGADKVYQGDNGWSPIIDGVNVTQNPVVDGFSEQANNIPLLIGTVTNEWTTMDLMSQMATSQTDNKNTWSDSQVEQKLRE